MIGRFLPKGLWGLIYWYALLPFHAWIYKGILRVMVESLHEPLKCNARSDLIPAGFETPGSIERLKGGKLAADRINHVFPGRFFMDLADYFANKKGTGYSGHRGRRRAR